MKVICWQWKSFVEHMKIIYWIWKSFVQHKKIISQTSKIHFLTYKSHFQNFAANEQPYIYYESSSSFYTSFLFCGTLLSWSYCYAAIPWLGIIFLLFILLPSGIYLVSNDFSDADPCFSNLLPLFFTSFFWITILLSLIQQIALVVHRMQQRVKGPERTRGDVC